MSHEKELERLKEQLSETHEMLSLLKQHHLNHSLMQTNLENHRERENLIEGAVMKLTEDQHEHAQQTDHLTNIELELTELKSIFIAMQQDLSDIKQLLKEQNTTNQPSPQQAQDSTKQTQSSKRPPSYNQLQRLAKSSKQVHASKKKQQINIK